MLYWTCLVYSTAGILKPLQKRRIIGNKDVVIAYYKSGIPIVHQATFANDPNRKRRMESKFCLGHDSARFSAQCKPECAIRSICDLAYVE